MFSYAYDFAPEVEVALIDEGWHHPFKNFALAHHGDPVGTAGYPTASVRLTEPN
jgi:hypothetical protein